MLIARSRMEHWKFLIKEEIKSIDFSLEEKAFVIFIKLSCALNSRLRNVCFKDPKVNAKATKDSGCCLSDPALDKKKENRLQRVSRTADRHG